MNVEDVVVALTVEGPVEEDVEEGAELEVLEVLDGAAELVEEIELEELIELLVVLPAAEEVEEIVELLELETEHDVVHADAVPTNITSCHPPFDQKVSMEAEDPVVVGVKVSVIVVLPAAGIVAPCAGNPVAVNALPTTTGLAVVVTLMYGAL